MTTTATSPEIEAYLSQVLGAHRALLERIRDMVRQEAPDAEELIAYGIPTFKLSGNLVHYAAFKNHLSFFPGGTTHNEALKNELAGYKLSKGTIQFTLDRPLPDDLIRKIVRLRITENRDLAAGRKASRRKK